MLTLPPAVLRSLQAHAEAAYPDEGAGLLLGRVADGHKTAVQALPLVNRWGSEEQYHRFLLTDREWRYGEAEAERRGLDLIGCFHSHPDHRAEPSEFDRDAAWPNFSYVITSVEKGRATLSRAWQLKDNRSGFAEEAIDVRAAE